MPKNDCEYYRTLDDCGFFCCMVTKPPMDGDSFNDDICECCDYCDDDDDEEDNQEEL